MAYHAPDYFFSVNIFISFLTISKDYFYIPFLLCGSDRNFYKMYFVV
ncbi:hypothetical protein XBP1_2980009 [Xenorhabdus bovienii str. puntauvense]|uniref:Uncharacterized protein n=1 Tax=Xenorhabdus bovienii str. puntauvense TaxID=1398201 RepID=A0A077N7P4_XENBV|nr:hypothetical protein XBFFL1_310143 [Xenorhabdus bovienii str. feltiae Florida]CDG98211.1 hypothetical protein XBP1_2980009 [Xenorhabdus bovienii str. puntauvense]